MKKYKIGTTILLRQLLNWFRDNKDMKEQIKNILQEMNEWELIIYKMRFQTIIYDCVMMEFKLKHTNYMNDTYGVV